MTKRCTLKESFVEKQLDKFQPDWRKGDDITTETKQKIKDYVASKLHKELKEDANCITDFSIWHMARKIRQREKLPKPKRTNKGKKVSMHQPQLYEENTAKQIDSNKGCDDTYANLSGKERKEFASCGTGSLLTVADAVRELVCLFGYDTVAHALEAIRNETPTTSNQENTIIGDRSLKGEEPKN